MSDYCFGTTDGHLDRRYPYSVGSFGIYDLPSPPPRPHIDRYSRWNQQKETAGEMSDVGDSMQRATA